MRPPGQVSPTGLTRGIILCRMPGTRWEAPRNGSRHRPRTRPPGLGADGRRTPLPMGHPLLRPAVRLGPAAHGPLRARPGRDPRPLPPPPGRDRAPVRSIPRRRQRLAPSIPGSCGDPTGRAPRDLAPHGSAARVSRRRDCPRLGEEGHRRPRTSDQGPGGARRSGAPRDQRTAHRGRERRHRDSGRRATQGVWATAGLRGLVRATLPLGATQ